MDRPIRPTEDAARDLAHGLMAQARSAALASLRTDGTPMATRIAFGLDPQGQPLTLVSDLAAHSVALRQTPACSVLIGKPGLKGDPLTHPRLTLYARARFVEHGDAAYAKMAAHYLRDHPKAKLYIDFADFAFVLFDISGADLNGGFGKAFRLIPADLGLS